MSEFESNDNNSADDESSVDDTVPPMTNSSGDSKKDQINSSGDVFEGQLIEDGGATKNEFADSQSEDIARTEENTGTDENTGTESIIDASEQPIRYGSPFAVDPYWDEPIQVEPELFLDVGPLRYTAMGAVAASGMVVLFASASAYWFPGGGTLVAGLGGLLAIFGLFSHYRFHALGCLIVHLLLFMTSYTRALS